jgi:glutathione synthase/RimK-type ligase-like ATP-grasp enzyme
MNYTISCQLIEVENLFLSSSMPNDLKNWTGVSVVNGTIIYGFRKNTSKISGWKVYDENKTGGDVTYVKPNKEIETIALKIGEILGANFYGLDFIKTAEGYKVVDINCSPGIYYDLIQDLDIPIAELFFKSMKITSNRSTKETVQV